MRYECAREDGSGTFLVTGTAVPGTDEILAVHEIGEEEEADGGYSLDHIPTGARITWTDTRERAEKLGKWLWKRCRKRKIRSQNIDTARSALSDADRERFKKLREVKR